MFLIKSFFIAFVFMFFSVQVYSEQVIYDYNQRFHPVVSEHGMVASQEKRASEIGLAILKQGGNAVDAAYAMAYALAVTLPRAGNIGGGGFMLLYSAKDKQVYAIDYREKAPMHASANMFLTENLTVDSDKSRYSLYAVGVPGTVAGFELARERFGTMPRQTLIKPAIRLAESGFEVGYDLSSSLKRARDRMLTNDAAAKIFYKSNGEAHNVGDTLIQKDLAKTLKAISKYGKKTFYDGEIAEKIVDYMQTENGLITKVDLKNYEAVVRTPVTGNYRSYTVYSMPPPSSGGIHLIQLLNILEPFNLSELGHNSAQSIYVMAEAMKYAYADRSKYLGDPDYVDIPTAFLLSKTRATQIADKIKENKVVSSDSIYPGMRHAISEGNETTHFTVMDSFGNVVSNTYTLNFSYGVKKVVPGTGILLNNQMDDFSSKPGAMNAYGLIGSKANEIVPGKRMLSSMTPTIVLKDGIPYLATGSPGGSRIITTVLQVLLNSIDYDMNIAEASVAPRLHHQWKPDELRIEEGLSKDTISLLEKMGYRVVKKWAMGSTQSIVKKDTYFYGYSDPRKPDALTVGY